MHAELLYTSAAAGLKKGSRGFCTVIATEGMPVNLSQRLESLSGYRHLYQPGDDRSDENPVCYSHLRFSLGGRFVHVVSRISAYGVDYSQRTNKLAHHVVVDPLPACGPASLLQSELMRTEWDGVCRTIPTGPLAPPLAVQAEVCHQWKAITGDAGWGGVLTNVWMEPVAKPFWIIYDVSQSASILPLIAESISLLPESKRWNASFSTYCASLPPDIECRVRCVVAGSEEARMAAARGTVINLTAIVGPPAPSNWVDAARTGVVPISLKPFATFDNLQARTSNEISLDEFDNKLKDQLKEEYRLRDAPIHSVPPVVKNKPKPSTRPRIVYSSKKYLAAGIVLFLLLGGISTVVSINYWLGDSSIRKVAEDPAKAPEIESDPAQDVANLNVELADSEPKKSPIDTLPDLSGINTSGTNGSTLDAASKPPVLEILAKYINESKIIDGIDGMLFPGQELSINGLQEEKPPVANWTIDGISTVIPISNPLAVESKYEGKIIRVGISGDAAHDFQDVTVLIVPTVNLQFQLTTLPPEDSIDDLEITTHYNMELTEKLQIRLDNFALQGQGESTIFLHNVIKRKGVMYDSIRDEHRTMVSSWKSIKNKEEQLRNFLESRNFPGRELWKHYESVPKKKHADFGASIRDLEQFVNICGEFTQIPTPPTSKLETLSNKWNQAKQKIGMQLQKNDQRVSTTTSTVSDTAVSVNGEILLFKSQFMDGTHRDLESRLKELKQLLAIYKENINSFVRKIEKVENSDKSLSFEFKGKNYTSSEKLHLKFDLVRPSDFEE